ncbi:unnamed protein product [Rotaria sp. Silwood2]|nr:unnamed protein product [Rotaria sp. Silwood2]
MNVSKIVKFVSDNKIKRHILSIYSAFIEKNAMAALQDSYTDLIKRIEAECLNRQRRSSITMNNEKDKENQSKKKHSQKQQSTKLNSTINDFSSDQQRKPTTHNETIHHTQSKSFFKYELTIKRMFDTEYLCLIASAHHRFEI